MVGAHENARHVPHPQPRHQAFQTIDRGQAEHCPARSAQLPMATPDERGHGLGGIGQEDGLGTLGGGRGFLPMAQAIHDSHQDAARRDREHRAIA